MTWIRPPRWMEEDDPEIVTGGVDFWVMLGSKRSQPFGFCLPEPEKAKKAKKAKKRRKKS